METTNNSEQNKPVNTLEKKELAEILNQVNQLRYNLGLKDEQIEELKAEKLIVMQAVSQQKQAFRSRVANIAKSYGIELGKTVDGVTWGFDEAEYTFKSQKTAEPVKTDA